jgi:hypothetical protein
MSSYDPEERALRPWREVVGGKSIGFGKWEAELKCGHTVIEDCDQSKPSLSKRLFCPYCEKTNPCQ